MAKRINSVESKLVEHICHHYRIDGSRYRMYQENIQDLSWTFYFGSVDEPNIDIKFAIQEMRKSVEDEFRGPVLKAAAPEAYARMEAVLKAYAMAYEPVNVHLSQTQMKEILNESKYPGFSSPSFDQPSRQEYRYDGTYISKVHPRRSKNSPGGI